MSYPTGHFAIMPLWDRLFGTWYVAEHMVRAMRAYGWTIVVGALGQPILYLLGLAVGLAALIDAFGEEPFERGNLDAGRLNWLLDREVVPAEEPFDPTSYEALLRVDLARARQSFPELFLDD